MSEAQTAETSKKKAAPTQADLPPAPPAHAIAPDMAATGPLSALGAPKEESPKQKAARELRAKVGHLVDALLSPGQSPEYALRRTGASIFVSHMVAVLGIEKAAAMTPAQCEAYAASFRARYPGAWGAAANSNVAMFVKQLRISGLRGAKDAAGKTEETPDEIMGEYREVSSQLAATG